MVYTEDQMVEIKAYLSDEYYSTLHGNFQNISDYYNQTYGVGAVRNDVTVYKSGTFRSQINSALVHLMGLGQTVYVPPWNDSKKAKEITGRLSRWAEAFLYWMDTRYMTNLRAAFTKHLLLYGMGTMKMLYLSTSRIMGDTEEMSKGDKKKAIEKWEVSLRRTFPFEFKVVHPSNILMDSSDPPAYIIENYSRTTGSIKREFPNWKSNDPDTQLKTWWEFWTDSQKQYFVENEPILTDAKEEDTEMAETDNAYGILPYEIGIADFGLQSPDMKPEEMISGIASHLLSSYLAETQLKTALLHGIKQGIYTMPTVNREPSESEMKIAKTLGEISIIPEDIGYKNLAPATVMPDAYKWLSIITDDQQSGVPISMQGRYPSGTTSGYQYVSARGTAELGLMPVKAAWEKTASKILDKVAWLTKWVIREPIGIMSGASNVETIQPDDIDPDVTIFKVTLDAETPEQKADRLMLGIRFLGLNPQRAPSLDTIYRDYLGLDPDSEDTKKLIELITHSPMVEQALAIEALRKFGFTDALKAIQGGQLKAEGNRQEHPYEQNPNMGTEGRAFQDYQKTLQGKTPLGEMPNQQTTEGANARNIETNTGG